MDILVGETCIEGIRTVMWKGMEDEGMISILFPFSRIAQPTAHFPQRLRITSDLRSNHYVRCHAHLSHFIYLYLLRVVSSAHQYTVFDYYHYKKSTGKAMG